MKCFVFSSSYPLFALPDVRWSRVAPGGVIGGVSRVAPGGGVGGVSRVAPGGGVGV